MSQRTEICKARKSAGLSCNGCQYGDDCEEKKQKETTDGIPADIKPGTKQAKIYGLLKEGKTAKEIIATKEFAPESVYIVARRHFPDAIEKQPKKSKQGEDVAMQAVDEYLKKDEEPAPETDEIKERILKLEKIVKDARNWRIRSAEVRGELKYALEKLKDGEFVKCYDAIKKALEKMEEET